MFRAHRTSLRHPACFNQHFSDEVILLEILFPGRSRNIISEGRQESGVSWRGGLPRKPYLGRNLGVRPKCRTTPVMEYSHNNAFSTYNFRCWVHSSHKILQQYSTVLFIMAVAIAHSLEEKLLRNEVASTLSVKLVKSVEPPMIAKTEGFDGILVDMEHASFDLETTSQLCISALYTGISPIVRVPSKDSLFVSRVLDGGALGVIVPHIHSVQDARDIVAAAKFQPIGSRSSTNGLPHYQFRTIPTKVSNPIMNDATTVVLMIETLEALELVDEIVAVEGVDSAHWDQRSDG